MSRILARSWASRAAAFSIPRVSRTGRLQGLLGGEAELELASALELGVELSAEQEGHVGDPQPEQRDHHASDRAVGLVVGAEVGDVEREADRGRQPYQDRHEGAHRDHPEVGEVDVGRRVVEERDDHHHDEREHRPLGPAPDHDEVVAHPDGTADRLCHRSADDQDHQRRRAERDGHDGEDDLHRPHPPERPPLGDLVDAVHRPAEGTDVARRRPQRAEQTQDQRQPQLWHRGEVGQGVLDPAGWCHW